VTIQAIAAVCHEANRAYCETLGDHSQIPWPDAPGWQRESAINGVRFSLDNPDAPPSASHESWLAEKAAAGWKYGDVKDAEAKTHTCFVPYEQLPIEQRLKDALFQHVVKALSPHDVPIILSLTLELREDRSDGRRSEAAAHTER